MNIRPRHLSPQHLSRSRRRRLLGLGLLAGMVVWPLVHRAPPSTCPPGIVVSPERPR